MFKVFFSQLVGVLLWGLYGRLVSDHIFHSITVAITCDDVSDGRWSSQLITTLSLWKPKFNIGPTHVGFVLDSDSWTGFSPSILVFTPSVSLHLPFIFIHPFVCHQCCITSIIDSFVKYHFPYPVSLCCCLYNFRAQIWTVPTLCCKFHVYFARFVKM